MLELRSGPGLALLERAERMRVLQSLSAGDVRPEHLPAANTGSFTHPMAWAHLYDAIHVVNQLARDHGAIDLLSRICAGFMLLRRSADRISKLEMTLREEDAQRLVSSGIL